ncbi:MAG TPA: hypothetical protein PKY87_12765, partial [Terricaulis sp.]|nr:hypothetical protein [Terricaulis sp.]
MAHAPYPLAEAIGVIPIGEIAGADAVVDAAAAKIGALYIKARMREQIRRTRGQPVPRGLGRFGRLQ